MINNPWPGKLIQAPRWRRHRPGNEAMRAVATIAAKQPTGNGPDDAAACKKLAKKAGEAARLLKLLGHEKRLLVLCFLAARGEMTVGEPVGAAKLAPCGLCKDLAKVAG